MKTVLLSTSDTRRGNHGLLTVLIMVPGRDLNPHSFLEIGEIDLRVTLDPTKDLQVGNALPLLATPLAKLQYRLATLHLGLEPHTMISTATPRMSLF